MQYKIGDDIYQWGGTYHRVLLIISKTYILRCASTRLLCLGEQNTGYVSITEIPKELKALILGDCNVKNINQL